MRRTRRHTNQSSRRSRAARTKDAKRGTATDDAATNAANAELLQNSHSQSVSYARRSIDSNVSFIMTWLRRVQNKFIDFNDSERKRCLRSLESFCKLLERDHDEDEEHVAEFRLKVRSLRNVHVVCSMDLQLVAFADDELRDDLEAVTRNVKANFGKVGNLAYHVETSIVVLDVVGSVFSSEDEDNE